MAIAFVQSGHGGSSSSGTPAATLGAAPIQGNLLVAFMFTTVATVPTVAAGWTALGAGVSSATTANRACLMAYKQAGAGESTSQSPLTATGPNTVLVAEYAGVDFSGTPYESPTYNAPAAGASQSTSSITPTSSANRLLVACFGTRGGSLGNWSAETIGGTTAAEREDFLFALSSANLALTERIVTSTSGAYSGAATSTITSTVCAHAIVAFKATTASFSGLLLLGVGT